jgi:hypothetical protein
MDWTKQTEDMFKTWTDTQKKMWDSWLETVQQASAPMQGAQVWQKTIETWEETVNNVLAAQTKWSETWANSFDPEGTPEEMAQWFKQAQEMAKQWNETQQSLWQNWFGLIKQADVTKMTGGWEEEGQKAFKNWQDSMQKVMDAQMDWIKMWAPSQPKAKK